MENTSLYEIFKNIREVAEDTVYACYYYAEDEEIPSDESVLFFVQEWLDEYETADGEKYHQEEYHAIKRFYEEYAGSADQE